MSIEAGSFAYLGPPGTYTEIALRRFLEPKEAISCSSIAQVFAAVCSGSVQAGLVPLESLAQGPVAETFDLLCENLGKTHIAASVTLPIQHALGALNKKGKKSEPLRKIFGHPQALQQCRRSISQRYPDAQLIETESNGHALQFVKQEPAGSAAAIAAEETLEANGLTILAKDIGDLAQNATRFAVLRRGAPACPEIPQPFGDEVTSIAINPRRDRQGLLFDLLRVISVDYGININSIHSRPDRHGGFIFFLDLDGAAGNEPLRSCLRGLEEYCQRDTGATAEVFLFGSYRSVPFHTPLFRTVGIIGGRGAMGSWFERFFQRAGIAVQIYDQKGTPNLSETVRASDVLLLSVPMNAIPEVAKQLAENVRAGQLVVENCSIKNSSLPVLLRELPENVEILGMHTMFGDAVSNLSAENIVLTKTPRSGKVAEEFEALFYKWGARITESPLQEHDRTTAVVQSLCHLLLISLAEVAGRNVSSPDALAPFHTPNSRAVFEAAQRVVYQSDAIVSDLQLLNPEAQQVRNQFLSVLFRLVSTLNQGNQIELLNTLHQGRAFFESRRK